MKTLLVILCLVLLVVLFPAELFAWSPSEGYQEGFLSGYVIRYPVSWVNVPSPFLLKAADPTGYPFLVGDVDTKGKASLYLDLARKMGATDLQVLGNIGFVTLPSGLRAKEGKINFVYQGSTYFATVLSADEKNVYFSCMVVFPWDSYNEAFAQDIFNTISKSITSKKK